MAIKSVTLTVDKTVGYVGDDFTFTVTLETDDVASYTRLYKVDIYINNVYQWTGYLSLEAFKNQVSDSFTLSFNEPGTYSIYVDASRYM